MVDSACRLKCLKSSLKSNGHYRRAEGTEGLLAWLKMPQLPKNQRMANLNHLKIAQHLN